MLGGCAGRSTERERIPSSIRCGASGFVFVLLIRTLKSSTFRVAVICIAVFSGAIVALLGFVYWATADYVHRRCDAEISADRASLVQAYEKAGRDVLVNTINQRIV